MAYNRRPRRDLLDDLQDFLTQVPFWVGPCLALIVFIAFRSMVPSTDPTAPRPSTPNPFGPFAGILSVLLPFAILLAWVLAEATKWRNRVRLDRQTGLASIRKMTWQDFEHLVGEAYRRRGFHVQHTGTASGDGGVDLVLTRDGCQTLVQCKQWRARRVGVKPVRELFGVVVANKADSGILVTSGCFTAEARRFAQSTPLTLMSGDKLAELIREVQTGATSAHAATPPPPTATPPPGAAVTASPAGKGRAAPVCPRCGVAMVTRVARRGQHAGQPFWGCPNFPQCREIAAYDGPR
jgi:restriction system protein